MKTILKIFFFLGFISFSYSQIIEGKVIKIKDGDTIEILLQGNNPITIRLNGIDAPEKKQAFGQKSKEKLSEMIFGKIVKVDCNGKDRYGRVIGDIYLDEVNINEEMVKSGLAWHYKKYSKSDILAEYEDEARNNRRGLWADKNPIPPWDFRKK